MMADPLADTSVEFGDRVMTVRELMDGWAAHVRRLDEEHACRLSELPSAWGVYDYHATLIVRSQLEAALRIISPDDRAIATTEVAAIDGRFLSFTAHDANHEMERFLDAIFNEPPGVEGWWWQRVPVSGPVREELTAFLAGRQSG